MQQLIRHVEYPSDDYNLEIINDKDDQYQDLAGKLKS
jgi:hypothetical protein